jgi:hypothetical protein
MSTVTDNAIHRFSVLLERINERTRFIKQLILHMSILCKMLDSNIEEHQVILRQITNLLLDEDILYFITYKHLVKIIKSGCLDHKYIHSGYINSNEILINVICKSWLSSRNQDMKRFEYVLRENRSFKYPFCDVFINSHIRGPRSLCPLSWDEAIDEGETEGHDTRLHWLIRNNDVNGVINALSQLDNPNLTNYYGYTSYTLAKRFGNPKIIMCLDLFRQKSFPTLACFNKLCCFPEDFVTFFQDLNEFLG